MHRRASWERRESNPRFGQILHTRRSICGCVAPCQQFFTLHSSFFIYKKGPAAASRTINLILYTQCYLYDVMPRLTTQA